MAEEKILHDFREPGTFAHWMAVHDVVMGGRSSGGMTATGDGTAVFEGVVSLANNGGFASVRCAPAWWDLGEHKGIFLRVRGDGKRYKLNLRANAAFDGLSYRQPFDTQAAVWQTLYLPFEDFEASFRGRVVADAPPFDPARVASIGFLISDKQAGPFRLEVAWIGAYSDLRAARSDQGGQ